MLTGTRVQSILDNSSDFKLVGSRFQYREGRYDTLGIVVDVGDSGQAYVTTRGRKLRNGDELIWNIEATIGRVAIGINQSKEKASKLFKNGWVLLNKPKFNRYISGQRIGQSYVHNRKQIVNRIVDCCIYPQQNDKALVRQSFPR